MNYSEIQKPTEDQLDWADLNLKRLERNQIQDYKVKVLNEIGEEPEVKGEFLLSEVCQAIIFNYHVEHDQRLKA